MGGEHDARRTAAPWRQRRGPVLVLAGFALAALAGLLWTGSPVVAGVNNGEQNLLAKVNNDDGLNAAADSTDDDYDDNDQADAQEREWATSIMDSLMFFTSKNSYASDSAWFKASQLAWEEFQETFRFPEKLPAWKASRMPPPYGTDLCFSVCDTSERICKDDLEEHVDRSSARNPFISTPKCPQPLPLPYYATVGYPMAGSTFFTDILQWHDNVAHACEKEIHFFDTDLVNMGRLRKNAKKLTFPIQGFFDCLNHKMSGDASQAANSIVGDNTIKDIFYDPWMPLWLKAINPRIKLMVLLRDPVKRAYSRYSMIGGGKYCRKFLPREVCHRNFDAYVPAQLEFIRTKCPDISPGGDPAAVYACGAGSANREDSDSIVSCLYVHHFRHWLNFFPASQFLVLESSKIFADPRREANRAFEFLGISPMDERTYQIKKEQNTAERYSHTKKAAPASPASLKVLADFFRPYDDQLKALVREEFGIEDLELIPKIYT